MIKEKNMSLLNRKADIGIIGALKEEVERLIDALEEREILTLGGVEFNYGKIEDKRVVVALCGVGKVFAALCAESMIVGFAPSLIVNTGVGGALASGLKTGDIVIADKLCQHDMDTSAIGDPVGLVSGINKVFFEADGAAVKTLTESASELGLTATVGTVASGDKFIASAEDKKRIVDTFAASACEMEGGAVAHVACVNGVPFAVIRAISDSADGEATMDYPTFMPTAARNSSALTLSLIKKLTVNVK